MATLQKRVSRGHAYWSIVESRRVNGKPRPVILEYLGTAEALLQRLREGLPQKVRSYSHGAVALMLAIAEELEVVPAINRHLPQRQLRDGFTVGGSLLLAAVGRSCLPTSKRNWYEGWARHTSLSYLLRMSLTKLDSQHFWDQMAALPVEAIPLIEEDIVKAVVDKEGISLDTLLCDTSNFFTYIDSTNHRCRIAQRGKNKQKRMDLRQFGFLLLVSRVAQIPIFHKLYRGNLADRSVFKAHFQQILRRFKAIGGSLEKITLVFDQGNNSKKTLAEVHGSVHFVGALSPYHHKDLIEAANKDMATILVDRREVVGCRLRTQIWQLDLSCVVYISEKLLAGQIRGLEQDLKKVFAKLKELQEKIRVPTKRGKKRTKEALEQKIKALVGSLADLIGWQIKPIEQDAFALDFWIEQKHYELLKTHWLGRRILITNRHQWSTEEIILAYWGQSQVEGVFKTIKNPFHLALRPQYHWTDQKIEVHGFICLLAFLLVMVAYKRAREQAGFAGSPHTLLEKLSAIRLATLIESPAQKTRGRYKVTRRLEEMDPDIDALAQALGLAELKLKTKIPFSVYN
jgi:transposase